MTSELAPAPADADWGAMRFDDPVDDTGLERRLFPAPPPSCTPPSAVVTASASTSTNPSPFPVRGTVPRPSVRRSPRPSSAPPSGSSSSSPANITSVVDAPRLVSSDASPTRPEWAVTCSTPAARAAAWNRSPTIFGESDTTRSSGAGLAATRNVSIARATPPFTNRTWRYKEQAIQRAASAFRRALGTDPLSSLVFVPIPPSKTRNDPLYDDRVTRMLRAIEGTDTIRAEIHGKELGLSPPF